MRVKKSFTQEKYWLQYVKNLFKMNDIFFFPFLIAGIKQGVANNFIFHFISAIIDTEPAM